MRPTWGQFASDVGARLDQGAREYGDRSFSKDPRVLVMEIEEELLDVAGWAFILWTRIRALRDAVEGLSVDPSSRP